MNPFDFVNSINFNKKNLMKESGNDELTEKLYVPFLVNRSLSYFTDTLLYANEMNHNHLLDNKLQYEFLLNSIRPKKRFAKWAKPENNDDLDIVCQYYGYSIQKAKDVLSVLNKQQLQSIRDKLTIGIKDND